MSRFCLKDRRFPTFVSGTSKHIVDSLIQIQSVPEGQQIPSVDIRGEFHITITGWTFSALTLSDAQI